MHSSKVVVHPLVLLSMSDSHSRMSKDRSIGLILGNTIDDTIHITNSVAIPFEEKEDSWFIDTSYLNTIYELFRKINVREKILGWYHTGNKMYKNDVEISTYFLNHTEDPFLLIFYPNNLENKLLVDLYQLIENDLQFRNISVEAEEAEEVGVEHLLREIKREDNYKSKVKGALKSYKYSLDVIIKYLENVESGKLIKNHKIIHLLQKCLNERPVFRDTNEDLLLECYSGELTKAVVYLNDLEVNRKENRAH